MKRPSPVQYKVASFVVVILLSVGGIVHLSNTWAKEACESRSESRTNIKGAFTDLIDVLDPRHESPLTADFERRLSIRIEPLEC